MPDVPNEPINDNDQEEPAELQGYQDDFDTSQRDQIGNEASETPVDDTPATRSEFAQGLRDTAMDEQDPNAPLMQNPSDQEPPLASEDDYREDIEDRDEDDKEKSEESWQ